MRSARRPGPLVWISAIAALAGLALGLIPLAGSLSGPAAPRPGPFLDGPIRVRDQTRTILDLRAPNGGASVIIFADGSPELDAAEAVRSAFFDRRVQVAVVTRGAIRGEDAATVAIVRDDPRDPLTRRFGVSDAAPSARAFVVDDDGRLAYRGPAMPVALRAAVAAVLAGDATAIAAKTGPAAVATFPTPPTFHADVAPILASRCRACHAPGRSAPFPLVTYAQAAKRAGDLAAVVADRLMPPWKPDPAASPPLRHDRTLLDAEIATIRAWAVAGAPEGPRTSDQDSIADLRPAAVDSVDTWALGPPDLVLEMPQDFAVPATGPDVYRCFVLPTRLVAPRAITAIEVRPGNPRVVHHTFAYVDTRGIGRDRDDADPGPGYPCFSGFTGDRVFGALGGWTPGNEAHFLPDGVGQTLPAGADVVMQVHYHPSGKPETDRTRLGLHFARTPVRQALQWVSACADPDEFDLPAGDPTITVRAELTLPMDVDLHAFTPHMHLLGRSITAVAALPDGHRRSLIAIKDWDFNRQDTYYLRDPMRLPAGTTIRLEGRFDNSDGNPRNPSRPPRGVRWGEATTDDMMIVFLGLTQAGQDLTRPGASDDFMEEFFRRAGVTADTAGLGSVR